jgi:hypothetical protein
LGQRGSRTTRAIGGRGGAVGLESGRPTEPRVSRRSVVLAGVAVVRAVSSGSMGRRRRREDGGVRWGAATDDGGDARGAAFLRWA